MEINIDLNTLEETEPSDDFGGITIVDYRSDPKKTERKKDQDQEGLHEETKRRIKEITELPVKEEGPTPGVWILNI